MTRRTLAFIVDCILFIAIPFGLMAVGFSLTHAIQGIMGAIIVITTIVFSLFLMIPCIFHIFMLVKFGGTPGHLLFSMRVKDKDTFESITIVFSKMNDKFPLWYYQPKVVSLYIYALKV
ncbi:MULTISPECIES: RDD family protein [unclassified Wolbachia]|uniref:RDD family protein n=1 Tax=unclassified Wolbachia TaxID=2640676 RepID=UPI001FE7B2FA|nr:MULTISPECIES: RDD family protein [unclassified Wolbachia]